MAHANKLHDIVLLLAGWWQHDSQELIGMTAAAEVDVSALAAYASDDAPRRASTDESATAV